jgi:hypothetical protein
MKLFFTPSSGTNYAVEVWDVKPHEVTPMSEVALTIIGVVNKTIGVPALRALIPPAEADPAALPQPTNTVNLRCDSRLKASRSDAFNHSVPAPPRGGVIGEVNGDE